MNREKLPTIKVIEEETEIEEEQEIEEEVPEEWRWEGEDLYFHVNDKYYSFIDETTSLTLGDKKIEVFSTPGHSKGSLSYYIDGKVFTGDALFYRSIGRTDFYDGDFAPYGEQGAFATDFAVAETKAAILGKYDIPSSICTTVVNAYISYVE